MNGGIQDAHNLAWKIAAALEGGNIELLLDSYDVERRAVTVGTFSTYADFITKIFSAIAGRLPYASLSHGAPSAGDQTGS